tara:strand:- start:28 stop:252 length:225 start_codon:yes stop_codon:yes gene_type:complete
MLPNDYIFYYNNDYYVNVYFFTYESALIMKHKLIMKNEPVYVRTIYVAIFFIAITVMFLYGAHLTNEMLALQAV